MRFDEKRRAYLSILRIRLITSMQYRVATFAGVGISFFWGLILTTILILFYRIGHRQDLTMTLAQGVTYIWFGQAFISLIPLGMDTEVYQKITSGDFAYELCRPLDLYNYWFMRIAALRIANTILRSGVALIVCAILPEPYRILPPVSFIALLATILALFGALLLSCSFTNLMNVFLLRVEIGPGLNSLVVSLVTVFSGILIPISIFPNWLQSILRILPFSGLMDFPAALYTGIIPVSDFWLVLGKQCIWVMILIAIGRWGLQRGLRRTVIQGG